MKKFTFLTFLAAAFLFSVLIITSCTKEGPAGTDGIDGAVGPAGPQGIAGEAGIDGTDGTAGCILCHTGGEEQGMFTQTNQWEASVHANGGNFERNGGDCGTCHTSQGFLANVAGTYAGSVSNPNPINCYTCHSIHETFTPADLALTTTTPVEMLINGDIVDFGKGNLCANCHQGRSYGDVLAIDGPDFTVTSPYWGAHHGPQANVLGGTGLFEFSGSATFGINTHATFIEDGCVTCHMADTYGVQAGGHTMKMTYEYHGSAAVWDAGCIECHTDSNELHAITEETQEEVEGLLHDLAALLNTEGILAVGAHRPTPGTYDANVVCAFINWAMLDEDRSLGVHNPGYVIGVLTNTIEAITP